MTYLLLFLIACLSIGGTILYFLGRRLESRLATMTRERDADKAHFNAELVRIHASYQNAAAHATAIYDQKVAELEAEAESVRHHYESHAMAEIAAAQEQAARVAADLESLQGFASLRDAEADVAQKLASAMAEADALKAEAEQLLEKAKEGSVAERAEAQKRAEHIQAQAEAFLNQANRDGALILYRANQRAEEIGGEAYAALRDKETIEKAARAIQNVVDGYGDRYIVPTHSLIDDLAADFGHTAAGHALQIAREQSRRMVVEGNAATCEYAEASRRETAIRFVIDAFNGRVDAILSRSKHDNYGQLEQEIKDAAALVNLNGQAFRNARILDSYVDSRITELKWAVAAQELKRKEREEQRQLQEQIREEEKARKEYERAVQEAAKEEDAIRRAMEKARVEVAQANDQQRAKLEAELAELNLRLQEAEEKNQRAISMAQQTRSGNVYIISNIGSFGEHVFKIGMTRRLEPLDRIKELGDASVPFDFDVHAMLRSDDAPGLERMLHSLFDDFRINRVNYRKEFFRIPLDRIRAAVSENALDATFTMVAEAREFRESLALDKMSPEERLKYHAKEEGEENDPADI